MLKKIEIAHSSARAASLGYAAFSQVDMLASRYTSVNLGAGTGAHSGDGAFEKAATRSGIPPFLKLTSWLHSTPSSTWARKRALTVVMAPSKKPLLPSSILNLGPPSFKSCRIRVTETVLLSQVPCYPGFGFEVSGMTWSVFGFEVSGMP